MFECKQVPLFSAAWQDDQHLFNLNEELQMYQVSVEYSFLTLSFPLLQLKLLKTRKPEFPELKATFLTFPKLISSASSTSTSTVLSTPG